MRKEMFDHEINILRDTYRRLLRRNAKINLIKLTNKTHPADLAVVFRYFSDEEQIEIFSLMKESEHTAEFLSELDDALVNELLKNESYERIAAIIEKAPPIKPAFFNPKARTNRDFSINCICGIFKKI